MTFQTVVGLWSVLALGTTLASPPKDVVKSEQEPRYDAATVVDFESVIVDVREVPKEGPLSGINLVVRTESDVTMGVYLAPVDFMKTFEITFRKGDRIHVIGSKMKFGGDIVVMAREVRKDSATLYLRGKGGEPYWRADGKPAS